jgi:hypothetical protein
MRPRRLHKPLPKPLLLKQNVTDLKKKNILNVKKKKVVANVRKKSVNDGKQKTVFKKRGNEKQLLNHNHHHLLQFFQV